MNLSSSNDPQKAGGRAETSRRSKLVSGLTPATQNFSFQAIISCCKRRPVKSLLLMLLAASWAGCAHENTAVPAAAITPAKITPSPAKAGTPDSLAINPEQIRTDCIAGRRIICGRVLKVLPDGLVVESGYTDLLREPLTQSWVVAGNVSAHRDPALLERNEPGTPCVGLAFLTDISKRKKVKKFDYVIIMGYPAGQYAYAPAPNVKKTIRKFSAGLETAVRLSLEAAEKTTNANAPQVKTNPAQS